MRPEGSPITTPLVECPKDKGHIPEEKKTITVNIIRVELDSVSADFIGQETIGTRVYATGQKTSENVIVQLKVSPSEMSLPSGFIAWDGGVAGSDQLKRMVSKSSLEIVGKDISAKADGVDIFSGKVYVFNSEINIGYGVVYYKNHSETVCEAPFGFITWDLANATITCRKYYENKKWKYSLINITYNATWGTKAGATNDPDGDFFDLSDPFADPFPCSGRKMDATWTETERMCRAIDDFTTQPDGTIIGRKSYWSKNLVEKHELFHADDFNDNYYLPMVGELIEYINSYEDVLTLENIAFDFLPIAENKFKSKLLSKTDAALFLFHKTDATDSLKGSEVRAYAAIKNDLDNLAFDILMRLFVF